MLRLSCSRSLNILRKATFHDVLAISRKTTATSLYGTSTEWKGENDLIEKLKRDSGSKFSGYIPGDAIEFHYSRSSGAGGQHVNKINSKVEARFHVGSATWIPDEVKSRLLQNEQSKMTKDGYLLVTSEKTRKQILNQADAVAKIRKMIFDANKAPNEMTQEDIDILSERETKAKEANMRYKRARAFKTRHYKYGYKPF